MSQLFRLLLCTSLLGCASTQLPSMNTAHAAEPAAGNSQTVSLQVGQTMVLQAPALSIQLVEFKDSRCPVGAHCGWAGHATATLLITRAGSAAETIVVGTQAPPAMQLPYQASSGDYQFTLKSLAPRPTIGGAAAADVVRASVLIEKR